MALEVSRLERAAEAFRSFSIHLESDIYTGWRFGSGRNIKPSLVDSLLHWLEHGDAVEYCRSYEDYLLAVIEIASDWSVTNHASSLSSSIWPRTPEEGGDPVPFASESFTHREDGALQATYGCIFTIEHPAFDPERFARALERKRHTRDDV